MRGNTELEIWKEYDTGLTGSYGLLVSNFGNFKNINWVDKKVSDNGAGYKFVIIHHRVDGVARSKCLYAHRLVASLFCPNPNPEELTQVNHKDGDKSNNHYSNLEWVSPSDNMRHSHERGLNIGRRQHGPTKKASDEVVAWAYYQVKFLGRGITDVATKSNLPRTTLSSIMNKRSRSSVTDRVDFVGQKYGADMTEDVFLDYI